MKSKTLVALATLLPAGAYAHPGHGSLGLFHHAGDAALLMVVCAAVWFGVSRLQQR